MNFQLYKICNIINDKVYIGQTTKSLSIRLTEHTKQSSNCKHLLHAISKYGKENFQIELIGSTSSQELADYLEIEFIKEFNSIENGYNLLAGGNCGWSGKKHSESTKKKMSASQSISQLGNQNFLGRKHTPESIKKMSNAKKGNQFGRKK